MTSFRLAAAGIVAVVCSQAMAGPAAPPTPLALQKIMRDMGASMETITRAIYLEDWQLVEETAPLIANHPQPPMTERVRIMSFVGPDVSKFKGLDGVTHNTAKVLGEVAASKDGQAVITQFAKLQSSCLACHESFRKPFQQHFYGTE